MEHGHKWSGWPGAWCLDCGAEDPFEIALADGDVDFDDNDKIIWKSQEAKEKYEKTNTCSFPGYHLADPYHEKEWSDSGEIPSFFEYLLLSGLFLDIKYS